MSSKGLEATPEQWRQAFEYANRVNAIEGIFPSEFGLQVQSWIAEGKTTVEDGVAMLVRYHTGRTQA